jgi:hypothetical protein
LFARKFITRFGTAALAVALAISGVAHAPSPVKAAVCTVSSVPSVSTIAAGGTFDVTIQVSTDTPSRGGQFILSWNPTLVQCTTAPKGTFFNAVADQFDNTAGKFPAQTSQTGTNPEAVALILGPPPGVPATAGATGTGAFYVLHMAAKTGVSGTATFTLSEVVLGDTSDIPVNLHPTVNNGSISITLGQGASPAVTTGAASNVTNTSATLSGNLTTVGSAGSAAVSFEWGTTTTYGQTTTPLTKSAISSFSTDITGLTANTLYHFRAKATDGTSTVYGADQTFTAHQPPAVSTSAASNITTTTATLNGSLDSMGSSSSVTVSFDWGINNTYGYSAGTDVKTTTGASSATINGLTAGTTYHYRVKGTAGTDVVYGSDQAFTASQSSTPTVTTTAPSSIASSSATLNGYVTAALNGARRHPTGKLPRPER